MSVLVLFFLRYDDHRDLHVLTHSFVPDALPIYGRPGTHGVDSLRTAAVAPHLVSQPPRRFAAASPRAVCRCGRRRNRTRQTRSEEHTSELQSLMRISYAVF